jgi:hypothetical protein
MSPSVGLAKAIPLVVKPNVQTALTTASAKEPRFPRCVSRERASSKAQLNSIREF